MIIIILPADKGRTTVIFNKTAYETKVNSLLSDTQTYKKLKKDPTPSMERKMNTMLLQLMKKGSIPDTLYKKLRSSGGYTPCL